MATSDRYTHTKLPNGRVRVVITIYPVLMEHHNVGECPDCHFDSLEHVTIGLIDKAGVTSHERTYCPRCKDIACDAR